MPGQRVKTVNFDVCKKTPKLIGYHSNVSSTTAKIISVFSARCNIYISHLCCDVSVRLPVCDGSQLAQIANLGFKFRSNLRSRGGVISTTTSRAMLTTARPSCIICTHDHTNAEKLVKFDQVLDEIFGMICRFLPFRPRRYKKLPEWSLGLVDRSSPKLHRM